MVTRRVVSGVLAAMISLGVSPAMAQQTSGVISGRANDEAKQPYTDYRVQLRDGATGQLVGTPQVLDGQGRFSFATLEMQRRYLVELFSVKDNKVVCTEGPYTLVANANRSSKTDVNIDCGKAPAALWLLAAGAGTAAAIAVTTRSASQ